MQSGVFQWKPWPAELYLFTMTNEKKDVYKGHSVIIRKVKSTLNHFWVPARVHTVYPSSYVIGDNELATAFKWPYNFLVSYTGLIMGETLNISKGSSSAIVHEAWFAQCLQRDIAYLW